MSYKMGEMDTLGKVGILVSKNKYKVGNNREQSRKTLRQRWASRGYNYDMYEITLGELGECVQKMREAIRDEEITTSGKLRGGMAQEQLNELMVNKYKDMIKRLIYDVCILSECMDMNIENELVELYKEVIKKNEKLLLDRMELLEEEAERKAEQRRMDIEEERRSRLEFEKSQAVMSIKYPGEAEESVAEMQAKKYLERLQNH